MLHIIKSLCREKQGAMLVEFALITPIILIVMAITLELGMALHQANVLEKHVMAGTSLAAHSDYPLDNTAVTRVTNLVRTGSINGGNDLLPGWNQADASLQVTTQTYNLNGETVPYVRIEAEVPYVPMIKGIVDSWGTEDFVISAAHEEIFIP